MEKEEALFDEDYWEGVDRRAMFEQGLAYPRHGSLAEAQSPGRGFPLPKYMMEALGIEEPQ